MKKLSSAVIKALAIFFALVMLLLAGCSDNSKTKVAYVKDSQLYFGNTQVTQQFLDDYYEEGKRPFVSDFENLVQTSDDGSVIYYPEKFLKGSAYTLYCKNNGGKAAKVGEQVLSYKISSDGKTAVYLDKDGCFYKFDGSQSKMIHKDVNSYRISKDGSRILYMTKYYTLYLKDNATGLSLLGEELIPADISGVTRCDDNLDVIYFITNIPTEERGLTDESGFRLYICTNGKDAKLVGKGISGPINWYYFQETDEVYYLSSDSYQHYEYTDYLINDLGAEGEEKFESFRGKGGDISTYSLWRCDGKQSEKIASNVDFAGKRVDGNEVSVAFYQYKTATDEKLPLSQATTTHKIDEHIKSIYHNFDNLSVTSNGQTSVMSQTNQKFLALTNDTLYFREGTNEIGGGTLYIAKIKDGKAETPKQIDNVHTCVMFGDSVVYIKDYIGANSTYGGDLYIDEQKVADNVMGINTYLDAEQNERLYALTEFDGKNRSSALNVYEDGKLKKVSDNVDGTRIYNHQGGLVYIKSSNTQTLTGTLCVYNNAQNKEISKNVYAVLCND